WLERREAWSGISLRRIRDIPEHTGIKLLHFYTRGQYNRYGLKVKINGKKTARLLLDSGASGIVLKRKYAKSAKVPLYGSEKTRGLGDEGDREAQIGLADTLEIGDLLFENYPISFAGKNTVLAEDGIIGTEVFSRFLITLDFNKKKMLLDELPDPPGIGEKESYSVYDYDWKPGPERDEYSPFRFMHGKVIVPSVINGREKVHLILDTGSSYNVFSHKLANKVDYTRATSTQLGGVSGKIKDIRRVNRIRISLAGIELGSHQTMAIDLGKVSHVLGTEIGGLVGYPFLKRGTLFLDYRTGSMKIIPDPRRVKSD
ncbi:MAG: aspartyl protease family protein, partial [Anaerolineales bacterium]|nr:aspartyl protease family protein [Anaerolineales bacterium]